jgi:hypothetical protein
MDRRWRIDLYQRPINVLIASDKARPRDEARRIAVNMVKL